MSNKLPEPVPPAIGRGRMYPDDRGWQPENHAWLDVLAPLGLSKEDGTRRRIGVDPMTLPLATLTAAGHPARRTSLSVRKLLVRADFPVVGSYSGFTGLRRYCRAECVPDSPASDVRNCAVIECPLWQFRMGQNPHNPRRGKLPEGLRKK